MSVPKKATQNDEVDGAIEPQLAPSDKSATGTQPHETQTQTQDVCDASQGQGDELLRNVLDKYQEKTEKEISKTIKVGSIQH